MPVTVDARGLACPHPVILAKKAIEENEEVTVFVDNDAAVENIRRLAVKAACKFSVAEREAGTWEISLKRPESTVQVPEGTVTREDERSGIASSGKEGSPLVVVLSDNRMGRGDDALGDVLIRSFIHTLLQLNPLPDTIICYNAGVKLTTRDSSVLDDLRQLEKAGTDILVCGTCVNYFEIGDQVVVGHISNMYAIAETMAGTSRLVRP